MEYLYYFLIFSNLFCVDCIVYDRFSGKVYDEHLKKEYYGANVTDRCLLAVKPCSRHEVSRTDGSCNSYKYPGRGAAGGPYRRLLPADYSSNDEIRKDKHNAPLPSARQVRTDLMMTGRVDRSQYTVAALHMMQFVHRDVSLLNGPRDYLQDRQYCCEDKGIWDKRCVPIPVAPTDPYLKVTDIRCLNFSRAESFQDRGCLPLSMTREQINLQTPTLDLSTIYGVDDEASSRVRKYEDGLLILDRRNDRYVPQNITDRKSSDTSNKYSTENNIIDDAMKNETETDNLEKEAEIKPTDRMADGNGNVTGRRICMQNKENETLCYLFGFPEAGNYGLRTTTLGIFFMREHNRIATALHKMNPCWKDDRLFKVAKQINIATLSNIYLYELLPLFLGYKNMAYYDLITDQYRYVTKYNEEEPPLIYAEFDIAVRFFNTLLDGRVKLYTERYHYSGGFSYSETLYRQALIEQDKNFEGINRGTFYQSSGKLDDIQDPELSDNFHGELQRAHDLSSIDIQRGRDLGVRGYNAYRQYCGMRQARRFVDLLDVIDVEKMETLKLLYREVDDIDLLAGIMSENFIEGTRVGPTLFCIMVKQLLVFKYSDRFWFERGDQQHSFTPTHLREVKRSNMARVACDAAEGIKYIQPQAFLAVKEGNIPVPCSQIPGPDLLKWKDPACTPLEDPYTPLGPSSYMEQGTTQNLSAFFDELLSYKPGTWFPRGN